MPERFEDDAAVPTPVRLMLCVVLALIAGHFTYLSQSAQPVPRDLAQVWFAARALLGGDNPYASIGPGRQFAFPYPLLYPLPAAVAAIPLAVLPMDVANVVFAGLVAAVFAWVLMRSGYGPLIGFFSASSYKAFYTVQWSPLFAAAVFLPPLAVFLIAKPTVGAAIFAARPSWWAIGGAIILSAVAFALQPSWVGDWLDAVESNRRAWAPASPYRAPIMFPGGVFVLACLARWRRPEARLVFVLACVPQTLSLYETVPLFLVPRRLWEALVLTVASYGTLLWVVAQLDAPNIPISLGLSGRAIVLAMYLPATLMILRRPNEGPVPEWLERRIASWPAWLRGRARVLT